MKKYLLIFAAAALALMAASCNPSQDQNTVKISLQLTLDATPLASQGVVVTLANDSGSASFEAETDESGVATFNVPAGTYAASAVWKEIEEGVKITYRGNNDNIVIAGATDNVIPIPVVRVVGSQIIIKELYSTGCPKEGGSYSADAYVILYNNSDVEADASDIVFAIPLPSNSQATNAYSTDGVLSYEKLDWIPAQAAIWWFTSPVKIPAYSQIVVAIFGAIDHTATYPNSVNLSNGDYYWMSKNDTYKNAKYAVAETIPSSHYLQCSPFGMGNAWLISNSSPALYIGKMSQADALALSTGTADFDHTAGTTAVSNAAKFPKAKILDCVETWKANDAKNTHRFSSDLNSGHVDITNNLGYTAYRNVDKEATEALPENAGKLVYNYAGGTFDPESQSGSTDPSGIDAEASIKAGAHIIYSDTNDSAKDFHQRKASSLK